MRKLIIALLIPIVLLCCSCSKNVQTSEKVYGKEDVITALDGKNYENTETETKDGKSYVSSYSFSYNEIKDLFNLTYYGRQAEGKVEVRIEINVIWSWGDLENASIISSYFYENKNDSSAYIEYKKYIITSFHFAQDYPNVVIDQFEVSDRSTTTSNILDVVTISLFEECINDVLNYCNKFVKFITNNNLQIQ